MAGTIGVRLDGLKPRRLLQEWSVTELARRAAVSDWTIYRVEDGGNCMGYVGQRILEALVPPQSITSASAANPCVVTKVGHGLQTGDTITIAGSTGTTPTINATVTVTRVDADTFSIGIDTSGGTDGTGGSLVPTGTGLGVAAL